ncbi:hypothetical protein Tco_0127309 [Tanacetum coccineum]
MKQGWKKVLKAALKHFLSAEKDLGSTAVLNDAGWIRSSVAREHFHDDRYGCLFRHSESVKTQGESSSRFQGEIGWTENRLSVQQDVVSSLHIYDKEEQCTYSFQQHIRSCAADCRLPAHGMVIANAGSNSVRGKDRR